MIHCEDAVAAVDYAVRHHLQGIYNLSDDEHPTLGHLYDELARHFRLPPVSWDSSRKGAQLNKRISNHKVKAEGFVLHHSHRVLE